MQRIIVIPPHYEGTSFADMTNGLRAALRKFPFQVRCVGPLRALPNRLGTEFLDDQCYLDGQASILQQLVRIGPVDQLLFLDFFQPGLSLVKYLYEQKKRHCRFGAFLHGGTFIANDLYSWNWLKKFETAWAGTYDVIYAPSHYLQSRFPIADRRKVKIFRFGLDGVVFPRARSARDIDVIFPHRLAEDKGVQDFLTMVARLPEISFGITVPQTRASFFRNPYLRKCARFHNIHLFINQGPKDHLKTFGRAKIVLSCAKQEMFGYGVMKAVAMGCVPVLPQGQCYPEFFEKKFLYKDQIAAMRMIKQYVVDAETLRSRAEFLRVQERIRSYSFVPLLKDFFKK